MDESREAEEIRQRLAQSRRRLVADTRHLLEAVRQATDWRAIPHKHPWMLVVGAAAVGFLAVPLRRSTSVLVNGQALSRITKVARPGLAATVGGLVVQLLVRTITATITRRLSEAVESRDSWHRDEPHVKHLPR